MKTVKEGDVWMSDLSDFLRKKKVEYNQEQVDWKMVKKEWIEQLQKFMTEIKIWLEQPKREGLIGIIEREVEITEEHIGKYNAPSLELTIGAERIKITPIGRFIIGASGRVDISSYIEKFIVLHHSEKGWIYRKDGNQTHFEKFTDVDFTKMLKYLV